MGRLGLRKLRLPALTLLAALGLSACQNVVIRPPDTNFYIPSWCVPHGCSWGGGA